MLPKFTFSRDFTAHTKTKNEKPNNYSTPQKVEVFRTQGNNAKSSLAVASSREKSLKSFRRRERVGGARVRHQHTDRILSRAALVRVVHAELPPGIIQIAEMFMSSINLLS
jgi:hypothetical protein